MDSVFQRHWGIRAERGDLSDDGDDDSVIIHVPVSDDEGMDKKEKTTRIEHVEADPLGPFMAVYKRMLMGLAGLCIVYVVTRF